MRSGDFIFIAQVLLCAALVILATADAHPLPRIENQGKVVPGTDPSWSQADDGDRSGEGNLQITHPGGVRLLAAGVPVANAGDGGSGPERSLFNSSRAIRDALLPGGQEERDIADLLSRTLLAGISDLISAFLDQEQTFGAEPNPTDNPIGGGDGYGELFTQADPRVTHTATTTEELLTALGSAKSGDVVYIDDTAHIDLTDVPGGVTVPGEVTLAGNRGERRTAGSARYSFEIETGDYVVWGLASAPHEESDSFWISVDAEEPRQWDLGIGPDWRWNEAGTRRFSGGHHTLTVHWREDGPKLDRILITDDTDYSPDTAAGERSGFQYIRIEAESGEISSPMKTERDPGASGEAYVSVPEGSGMGEYPISPGGRIFLSSTDPEYPAGLIVGGENVRITGLRIEGPYRDTEWVDEKLIGIFCPYRNLEVDNCELLGWNGAAITLAGTGGGAEMKTGGYIHHNNIHHCQMDGLGYGVVVSGGSEALIEANYFDYVRHAIAGTGVAGDGYEARYNICGPNALATSPHPFDMHGKPDPNGSGTIAGDTIKIHHNTFLATQPSGAYPVAIRGVPRDGAYIDHNWFHYTRAEPVWQTDGRENVFVTDNLIGSERDLYEEGPIRYV